MNNTTNNPKQKLEEQIRRSTERAVDASKEGLNRLSAATTEATDMVRTCCSKTVKGAQDYHNKVLEFAQTNANRSFELAVRLLHVKSPAEFFEISSEHARRQWETIADQAKQLTELAQSATASSAEPLRSGFEKVFKSAA
jgi:phasin